jgi:hypothetical protein
MLVVPECGSGGNLLLNGSKRQEHYPLCQALESVLCTPDFIFESSHKMSHKEYFIQP